MSYTHEVIETLMDEVKSTDTTAERLLPILNEIIISKEFGMDLLCEKLLIEAQIFNMIASK